MRAQVIHLDTVKQNLYQLQLARTGRDMDKRNRFYRHHIKPHVHFAKCVIGWGCFIAVSLYGLGMIMKSILTN